MSGIIDFKADRAPRYWGLSTEDDYEDGATVGRNRVTMLLPARKASLAIPKSQIHFHRAVTITLSLEEMAHTAIVNDKSNKEEWMRKKLVVVFQGGVVLFLAGLLTLLITPFFQIAVGRVVGAGLLALGAVAAALSLLRGQDIDANLG